MHFNINVDFYIILRYLVTLRHVSMSMVFISCLWQQKMDGCNKMTCTKCREYFCWLCNGSLSRSNPYAHYSAKGSKCQNRLFEGMEDDDLWDDEDEEDWL